MRPTLLKNYAWDPWKKEWRKCSITEGFRRHCCTNKWSRESHRPTGVCHGRQRERVGKKKKKTPFPSCRISTHLNLIFLLHLYSIPHSLVIIPHFDSPVMSSNDKPTVLIVGAGLGGLMLGALLEKSNVPYTIFERAAMVKPLGRWLFSLNRRPTCSHGHIY